MANTEPESRQIERDSLFQIDPSTAEGRSRAVFVGGMGWLALGSFLELGFVVWGGVLIIAGAFLLNTLGKFAHYRTLSIGQSDELKLTLSWTLLSLSVLGLILNFAYTRYGPGDGDFFWSLALAGLGFGLLHMAAQAKFLPEETPE